MITAALLGKLPLDSRFFGPPRRHCFCVDYPHAARLRARRVSAPEMLPSAPPRWFGPVAEGYLPTEDGFPARHPLDVFSLERGRVLGPDAFVVAPGDYILEDFAWRQPGRPTALIPSGVMQRRRAYPSIRLKGRVAFIASNWSLGGFGHFCTDALPRWRMLLDAGFAATDFEHILVYHPKTTSSHALIAALGLGSRIVHAEHSVDYACEELVFTSFPHLVPRFTPRLLSYVRDLMPPRRPVRRIYLSREGYRHHPVNAAELEKLLGEFGFETIPSRDNLGAIEACRDAAIVIGVEGSNLFNALFCPPGTRIVNLLRENCPIPYLSGICAALGHSEGIVSPAPRNPSGRPFFDPTDVRAALDWAAAP